MSAKAHPGAAAGHPAPARDRASAVDFSLVLAGAPAAWLGQLLFAFAATSYLCQPAASGPPGWLQPTLIGVNIVGLVIAVTALAIAVLLVHCTKHELRGGGELLDVGEGRTRFLAIWGVIISAVFIVAIFANSFSLLLVPLCRV